MSAKYVIKLISCHGFAQKKNTLYPAHSKVGRGNLVLRHSVPHLWPNEFRSSLRLNTRAKNWKKYILFLFKILFSNFNKYFERRDRTYNQSRLQSHTCASVPQLGVSRLILWQEGENERNSVPPVRIEPTTYGSTLRRP